MSTISLQLPSNYFEIEKDEIEYVDGGYLVGTYSYTNSAGVNYLRGQALMWAGSAGASFYVAMVSAAAGVASSPSIIGGIAGGLTSVFSSIIGSYCCSNAMSALEAMASAERMMSAKHSYSVYNDQVLWQTYGYGVC